MIVCLVTDRRRLGASVGAPPSEYLAVLSEQIAAAAAAGVDFVQIREPDLEARPLTAFIRSAAAKLRGSKTRILVNDRLDVALAAGADGVHLKESSVAPELARSLAPKDFVVACAVHTALTAAARRSADFIVAGTVLPTVWKVRADYLEWRGLAEVIGAANGTPVVGIGGLDLASIPSLARTGAAGLAAIGAFIPTSGKLGIDEFVKKRVSDMRFAFDSAQSRP